MENLKLIFWIAVFIFAIYKIVSNLKKAFSKKKTSSIAKETILDDGTKRIEVAHNYTIQVPSYMVATRDLNDNAEIQYKNELRETYLIISREPVSEFIATQKEQGNYDLKYTSLENYKTIQHIAFIKTMEVIEEFTNQTNLDEASGSGSITIGFNARVEGIDDPLTYLMKFIEKEGHLYLILLWTLKAHFEEYKEEFERIQNSFKIIPLLQ